MGSKQAEIVSREVKKTKTKKNRKCKVCICHVECTCTCISQMLQMLHLQKGALHAISSFFRCTWKKATNWCLKWAPGMCSRSCGRSCRCVVCPLPHFKAFRSVPRDAIGTGSGNSERRRVVRWGMRWKYIRPGLLTTGYKGACTIRVSRWLMTPALRTTDEIPRSNDHEK